MYSTNEFEEIVEIVKSTPGMNKVDISPTISDYFASFFICGKTKKYFISLMRGIQGTKIGFRCKWYCEFSPGGSRLPVKLEDVLDDMPEEAVMNILFNLDIFNSDIISPQEE